MRGEVYEVVVNSVDLLEENLLNMQDEVLYFTVTAEILFSTEVSYPDPDITIYDSEDRKFFVLDKIKETLEKTTEVLAVGFMLLLDCRLYDINLQCQNERFLVKL